MSESTSKHILTDLAPPAQGAGQAEPLLEELRTLIDTIPALAWMAGVDGSIFWYNARWYQYTGTTPQEMAGWGWQKVHDPAALPSVIERWTASIRTGEPFEMVFPLRGADGIFRSFLTRVVPSRNATGDIVHWFGTNTEVDELERTRAALADERSLLSAVIDSVPVGLVFADASGRVSGGNKQAERIFRHPILLSADIGAYGEWNSYHPDGRRVEPHEYPLAQTLADGDPHTAEVLYHCGDGSQRWVIFSSAPVRDADGNTSGGVAATLDIDERRRGQEALQQKTDALQQKTDALQQKTAEAERQHAELATIYDTAPIGLALFSVPDYRYLRLNERQAAFFGLRPDQIVGKTLTEMAPIKGLRELFDQVAGGEPVINYPLEGSLTTDPENHRFWTVSYFPVYAADGSIQAITAASLEITHQKKAEQALIQSEKLAVVGRLASSIAHEINNPLEAVTNLLYLAGVSSEKDEILGFVEKAEVELRRVAAITSQTLRFHKQASSPQAITAQQLIDSVLSIFHGRILNTQLHITERNRAHTPVRCFEGEIRQVISNLVGNALDAMSPTGTLFLRSREATHWLTGERGLTLTVADTGSGMSPDTLSRLFNPFFTTKGLTGTGLGLWVSKEIIDRHRGSLRVRSSQSPHHHGTVFTLFLPFDAATR